MVASHRDTFACLKCEIVSLLNYPHFPERAIVALSLVIGGLNREHALIFAATSVLPQVLVQYRRVSNCLRRQ
jgi:hypothetical protein